MHALNFFVALAMSPDVNIILMTSPKRRRGFGDASANMFAMSPDHQKVTSGVQKSVKKPSGTEPLSQSKCRKQASDFFSKINTRSAYFVAKQ